MPSPRPHHGHYTRAAISSVTTTTTTKQDVHSSSSNAALGARGEADDIKNPTHSTGVCSPCRRVNYSTPTLQKGGPRVHRHVWAVLDGLEDG